MTFIEWLLKPNRVTSQWLSEQERVEMRNQFISVNWKWPIDKIKNEGR